MKRRKSSFRHDSIQDPKSISAILKALMDGIEKGRVTFSDEDDKITMKPEGLLNLRLTASQEEHRHRINLRISWESRRRKPPKRKALDVSAK